jgi:hypothetical protein
MSPELVIVGFVLVLFAGVLACMALGRRIGMRRAPNPADASNVGLGAIEGSAFALLGLLIAFTFSGASSRFDGRRQLIVTEANAIGTAYLRLDLLPTASRDKLRDEFKRYVDARLEAYALASSEEAISTAISRAVGLQSEIWTDAVVACKEAGAHETSMLLLPALNDMIDVTTTRAVARTVHQPILILIVIALLACTCGLLAGYDMASRKSARWIHKLCFAGMVAITMYVILDLEYPRSGLIRIDATDRVLEDVRSAMK